MSALARLRERHRDATVGGYVGSDIDWFCRPALNRKAVHALRLVDADSTWRLIYRIDDDAIVIVFRSQKRSRRRHRRRPRP